MKKQIVTILVALMAITLASAVAGADPVQVVTYDVRQTPISGFGCWYHTYNGAIVDTGRIDTGSVSCTYDKINHIADYSGGSGTLNDGVFNIGHLFLNNRPDSIGNLIVPVITLHLANAVRVTQINVFGTGFGDLAAATVEINGVSVNVPVTAGTPGVLDLATTPLSDLPTSTIVLRDFVVSPWLGIDLDQFSLAEVTVDGTTLPPLTLELRIDPIGSVAPKTGVATISGTLTCSRPVFVDGIFTELNEKVGRVIINGNVLNPLMCNGVTPWKNTISGLNGLFVPGNANVIAFAEVFDPDGFIFDDASAVVQLRGTR